MIYGAVQTLIICKICHAWPNMCCPKPFIYKMRQQIFPELFAHLCVYVYDESRSIIIMYSMCQYCKGTYIDDDNDF